MTSPAGWRMNSLGDAWIDVHGDTNPFEREVERGVREAANDADDDAREGGDNLGETMAEAMGDRLRESGPMLAREVERGLSRQKIRTKVTAQLDKEGNVVRQWVTTITDEITEAFSEVGDGRSGIFKRFQTGFADAIGAGFNVSGRSPLVALLIPLVGVITGLVIGALQAANALVAVLATAPALIAAIGLQVGIVAIAFQGVGTAIQGAFAAKNAKELNEALKDLTPSARAFVLQLLPLRDFFKEVQDFVQENFFAGLGQLFGTGGALTPLMGVVGGLGPVARDLGEFFQGIARAFGSPAFVRFVELVLPSISRFLDRAGPQLTKFLDGISNLSIVALPTLERIGSDLMAAIGMLGTFFTETSKSGEAGSWLDSMYNTLLSIQLLIGSVIGFTKTLLKGLDEAGGRGVIDAFTAAFDQLIFFLQTPVGQKALEGLINGAIISIMIFTGLIETILAVIALIQFLSESVKEFFRAIGEAWDAVVDFFTGADDQIKQTLGSINLFEVGKNIISSLINGMRAMVPNVRGIMNTITSTIRGFWPFSPAKEGPLSGSGDPMQAGENIINRLAQGITAGSQELGSTMNSSMSNIIFGPGAIRIGFEGALPTTQQAMQTGVAVGQGALAILARNTQLAVRGA